MPLDWHRRYLQQAKWTSQIRDYLYRKAEANHAKIVLEVGCGTGAILNDQAFPPNTTRVGVDIAHSSLLSAKWRLKDCNFINADGHYLPLADRTFDITFCHFLLLWTSQPQKIIYEMKRVTRQGGFVLAMAEPDYDGRIDYPEIFEKLGALQTQGLVQQGAKPDIGRKLRGLFASVGFNRIDVGVIGGQWDRFPGNEEWEMEWQVLKSDLSGFVSNEWLDEIQQKDYRSWQEQERILFVPVFYAFGQVPFD
jgi:ubiquinone/menaquinone biosynthesis C-methylase UbiE